MQMNFYSLFGPNIYSSNNETTDEVSPPSSRDILSNIFSTEIQDLLAQVLNQPTTTSQESQTEPTATTTEATGEDDLIYFEPAASNGISLSVLNTVSTLSVKTDDAESTCVICHNNIERDSIYRQLNPCGHMFHVPCIDQWLQNNSTCPVCRIQIGNSENENNGRVRRSSTFLPIYSIRYS